MRNTLYSHTWPLSPLPGQKKSRQCTGRCISCVCCAGGCSRCPVLLLPPGSYPDTLDGRPSPGFGTPRSLAVSGRHLGPVPLGRPPLQAWRREQKGYKLSMLLNFFCLFLWPSVGYIWHINNNSTLLVDSIEDKKRTVKWDEVTPWGMTQRKNPLL